MKDALEAYLSGISFSAQGKHGEALLSFERTLALDPLKMQVHGSARALRLPVSASMTRAYRLSTGQSP